LIESAVAVSEVFAALLQAAKAAAIANTNSTFFIFVIFKF
jgi:hypothetical protein